MSPEVKTRSPLKVSPLRNPGQSLDEELQRILVDKFLPYFIFPPLFIALAIGEWSRLYLSSSPSPRFATVLALISVLYSIYQVRKMRPKLRALKLGREGEKVVGQSLEDLRSSGAIVLHDIMADGFNVDHVVISSKGIFVIETKTRSKPNGRDAKITFDGDKVSIDGRFPTRDPVKQVVANTAWVQEMLKERTGRSFPARPVVLFPGWFVETVGARAHDRVWVLNPKGLPAFIDQEKPTLSLEDMKTATCHLAQHVRSIK
jgi:hypothetical protein